MTIILSNLQYISNFQTLFSKSPVHHAYLYVISAYKYLGSENSVYVTQRYIEEFRCHFVLTNYPFDTQVHLTIFTNT